MSALAWTFLIITIIIIIFAGPIIYNDWKKRHKHIPE